MKISPLNSKNNNTSNLNEKENTNNRVPDIESKCDYEEMEESLKDEKTSDKKRKEFYEIKSSDKKILKELSFSITTPEPNSPKINLISSKSNNKTFKTPLSSQVKNFHLSSDISIEETVEALLSTPTPLPLSLGSKSFFKNDKELLKKSNISLFIYLY